jgi:hypothetical protein
MFSDLYFQCFTLAEKINARTLRFLVEVLHPPSRPEISPPRDRRQTDVRYQVDLKCRSHRFRVWVTGAERRLYMRVDGFKCRSRIVSAGLRSKGRVGDRCLADGAYTRERNLDWLVYEGPADLIA